MVKNPPANTGDAGLIPGSGRFPGDGYGNPLQYLCLENPMNRGAWQGYSPWGHKRVRQDSETKQEQHRYLYFEPNFHIKYTPRLRKGVSSDPKI